MSNEQSDDGVHPAPLPPPPTRRQAKRARARFGLEVVVAALLVGAVAGGITGHLTARRQRESTSPTSTTATTSTTLGSTTTTVATTMTTEPNTGSSTATTAVVSATLQQLVKQITPSVVDIHVTGEFIDQYGRRRTGEWAGSGFVIDASGIIATNAHVVDGAKTITVSIHDGTTAEATVLGSDPDHDLAVIKIERSDLRALTLGTSIELQVGDPVVAAGNALNLEGNPTITVGIISGLERTIDLEDGSSLSDLIQTDAAISSGDSGGPLLTTAGEVIGVDTAGASSTDTTTAQNIGFAIPISVAAPILRKLAGLPA